MLEQFARRQTEDGDRVQVVSFDDPSDEAARAFKYPLVALGPCKTFYGYTPRLAAWLRNHARDYDVVLVHGIWQYHSTAAWQVLRKLGVPYAIYTHGMLDPGHHKVSRLKQFKKQLYWWMLEFRVLRDAAAVLFSTEEERRLAPEGIWPLRLSRSMVVPHGLEEPQGDAKAQREAFLTRFPELRGQRILLFLGRFDPKKGVKLLIDAYAQRAEAHPDVTLVMAGPDQGPESEALKKRIPERLAGRVVWTGLLLNEEKWGAFRAAEAFIIPSHTENYCIAAVESLACGVPVLMSNKVNIHPTVSAHKAGFVENDDEAGCLRLLDRWLATSRPDWGKMRENAQLCYRKEFVMSDAYARYREAVSLIKKSGGRECHPI